MKTREILLAKYGIVESSNENGDYDIQRIDDVIDFKHSLELNFIPPLLESDEEAKRIFKTLSL